MEMPSSGTAIAHNTSLTTWSSIHPTIFLSAAILILGALSVCAVCLGYTMLYLSKPVRSTRGFYVCMGSPISFYRGWCDMKV